MRYLSRRHPYATIVAGFFALAGFTGCESPSRPAKYPEGALQVRYEQATHYSTCLVASVAMAANYLIGQRRFSENGICQDLKQAGLDETRAGDLQTYLARHTLHLVTLKGALDGKPPTGLRYWLCKRGYPVICVINPAPANPGFNHAVVVIAISTTPGVETTDRIHYLDPSSAQPLHTSSAAAFETLWDGGQHAMMIIVAPPASEKADEMR